MRLEEMRKAPVHSGPPMSLPAEATYVRKRTMISKTGIHAIKALAALAELPEGTYAGAGAIAGQIGARANYLGKLLQALSHHGLVVSQKGMGGGFRLGREPQTITLLDVVEPIDHVSRWGGCFLGGGRCADSAPCAVHQRWGDGARGLPEVFKRNHHCRPGQPPRTGRTAGGGLIFSGQNSIRTCV